MLYEVITLLLAALSGADERGAASVDSAVGAASARYRGRAGRQSAAQDR